MITYKTVVHQNQDTDIDTIHQYYSDFPSFLVLLCVCRCVHMYFGEGNGTPLQHSCLENLYQINMYHLLNLS